jgi:hypothetical protein
VTQEKHHSSTIARHNTLLFYYLTNLSVKIWDVDHAVLPRMEVNRGGAKAMAVAARVAVTG